MLDIGGGSTELLLADGDHGSSPLVSTGLGVVKLTERFLHRPTRPTPGRAGDGTAARAANRFARAPARMRFRGTDARGRLGGNRRDGDEPCGRRPRRWIRYDPDRVTGHRLTRERVAELLSPAGRPCRSHDRRRGPRARSPRRADVIVAGDGGVPRGHGRPLGAGPRSSSWSAMPRGSAGGGRSCSDALLTAAYAAPGRIRSLGGNLTRPG
ncbi:MAG: hypothetical protein MZV70_04950 [Desulfobacterales bacterium]|nr:hypothetical protein [Desulfobacterales bacterium]